MEFEILGNSNRVNVKSQTYFEAKQKTAVIREQEFFKFWKKGVALAGVSLFGDGTEESFSKSTKKEDLAPVLRLVEEMFEDLDISETAFLASMYSFYNTYDAAKFFKAADLNTVCDLSVLDTKHREVIGALLINYSGW